MGSKRTMLMNGLGTLLKTEAANCDRVVDLFCGGGSVAWFAAQNSDKPILATDLQEYAATLARAVIGRTAPAEADELKKSWLQAGIAERSKHVFWTRALELENGSINTATWCKRARELCAKEVQDGLIWSAYGGYYFSPTQAITFDALLRVMPAEEPARSLCLASLIVAASQCVASPGHTAQPFQPTRTAGEFLREAWKRDPLSYAEKALVMLCPLHAKITGEAKVSDALVEAKTLKSGDLVFLDPPYSGVHYSRFYHVLETIARGKCSEVEGVGRYPPPEERPTSSFSRRGESKEELSMLLSHLANVGCTVILTFPAGECSNGLSGGFVERSARKRFKVQRKTVAGRFSTLGGNNSHRDARQASREMILVLRPKNL